MLGQNQKFGEYTTLVNVSAKSTTLVNALAANGIGYHVSERIVGKPKPLIVDSLQTLSREEMSIQIRLTGQFPSARAKDQKRFPRSIVTSGNACKAMLEWVSSE